MSAVLTIGKAGDVRELAIKEYSEATLYKRAGFKQAAGFGEKFSWPDVVHGEPCVVRVFGKTEGRAPQLSAFQFPAGMCDLQFFGNIMLVATRGDAVVGLKREFMSRLGSEEPARGRPAPPRKDRADPPRAPADEGAKNCFDCSLELTEGEYV